MLYWGATQFRKYMAALPPGLLFFFLRSTRKTAPAIAMTPGTAPTAMPALAPVLSPLFVGTGKGLEVLVPVETVAGEVVVGGGRRRRRRRVADSSTIL